MYYQVPTCKIVKQVPTYKIVKQGCYYYIYENNLFQQGPYFTKWGARLGLKRRIKNNKQPITIEQYNEKGQLIDE